MAQHRTNSGKVDTVAQHGCRCRMPQKVGAPTERFGFLPGRALPARGDSRRTWTRDGWVFAQLTNTRDVARAWPRHLAR